MENNFIPPISIEKFAAYLDENLSADEMHHMSALVGADSKMQEIMELSNFMDDSLHDNNNDSTKLPDEILSMNFEIPSIDTDSYDLQKEILFNDGVASLHLTVDSIVDVETDINSDNKPEDDFFEKNCEEGDRINENELSINTDESDKHLVDTDESNDLDNNINIHQSDYCSGDENTINTMVTKTLQSNTILYGESGENISDPIFIRQPDDHSCALRSQQIVLRDFGIDIPFKDLEKIALDNRVYSNEGTYTYDIGKVLEIAGVGMHQVAGCSMYDLTSELAQGHRVIVSVDAKELWYNDNFTDKLKNWFDDTFGNQGGNHALIVAGVEVNPYNLNDVKVVLTDPGAGHLRVEYPLDQFMNAWKDSNCFMAATDNAAPYQYDAETGMEIPSNFAVQQYINEFVASNGYKLSPDMINIPQDYQPAFTGHLNIVGCMDYESFEETYNDILDSRIPSDLSIKEQIEEMAKSQEASDEDIEKQEDSHHEDIKQETSDESLCTQEGLVVDEGYEKEDGLLDDDNNNSDEHDDDEHDDDDDDEYGE